jgi:hypothetical protein
VRAEGFEPPQRRAAGLQPAPTLPRWRARAMQFGCLTGFEPVLPESQSGALPLSYSHHRYFRAYPRRDLNPQPSVCRTVALPLSYTGMCGTYPGLELNQRPPSYQDGALPLSYQDGSEGWPRCLCSRLRYVCSRLSPASARRYAAKGSNFRPRIKSPVLNHSASGAGTHGVEEGEGVEPSRVTVAQFSRLVAHRWAPPSNVSGHARTSYP